MRPPGQFGEIWNAPWMSHRCAHRSGVIISPGHMRWGMGEYEWGSDSKPIREFIELAQAAGWQPSSIDGGRLVLKKYEEFARGIFRVGLDCAGWREFAAYKTHLCQSGIKRSTIKGYLVWIVSYYRLKAESSQSPRSFDNYARVQMIGRIFKAASGRGWKGSNQKGRTVSDLALFLKQNRHLFSVCPECGNVHRLSDLQLAQKGRYQPDWLDALEKRQERWEN